MPIGAAARANQTPAPRCSQWVVIIAASTRSTVPMDEELSPTWTEKLAMSSTHPVAEPPPVAIQMMSARDSRPSKTSIAAELGGMIRPMATPRRTATANTPTLSSQSRSAAAPAPVATSPTRSKPRARELDRARALQAPTPVRTAAKKEKPGTEHYSTRPRSFPQTNQLVFQVSAGHNCRHVRPSLPPSEPRWVRLHLRGGFRDRTDPIHRSACRQWSLESSLASSVWWAERRSIGGLYDTRKSSPQSFWESTPGSSLPRIRRQDSSPSGSFSEAGPT